MKDFIGPILLLLFFIFSYLYMAYIGVWKINGTIFFCLILMIFTQISLIIGIGKTKKKNDKLIAESDDLTL